MKIYVLNIFRTFPLFPIVTPGSSNAKKLPLFFYGISLLDPRAPTLQVLSSRCWILDFRSDAEKGIPNGDSNEWMDWYTPEI